jgi:hypothetical protein
VARRVVARSDGAEERLQAADVDLVPLDELIRRAPGARRISSIDDLRCGAFDTEEELEEFLAFVSESRHGAGGSRRQDVVPSVPVGHLVPQSLVTPSEPLQPEATVATDAPRPWRGLRSRDVASEVG